MKSKPVYPERLTLEVTARVHRFIVQGEEAQARCQPLRDALPVEAGSLLVAVGETVPTADELTRDAPAGTAFYVLGPEVFVWKITACLRTAGVAPTRIRQQVVGNWNRDVYCVHCNRITTGVKTTLFDCPSCHLTLFVRDHFSRPLGAYMGVNADAELPGELPPLQEVYV